MKKAVLIKCIVSILIVTSVIAPSACGGPAEAAFEVRALNITPAEASIGELVTVSADVENVGDVEGNYTASLTIDGIGDLRVNLRSVLNQAISEDSLISVRSLCSSFPADPKEARLSYAQSYSLVDFLIRNYGKDKMLQLLSVFKEGSSYDGALLEVYDFDMDGLDNLWRQSLGLAPRPAAGVLIPAAQSPLAQICPNIVMGRG